MLLIGFGDLAQSNALRHHMSRTKANMARLSQELTTGQAADIPKFLSGDISPLASLDASRSRLDGYGAVTRELALFANGMQTSLGTVSAMALTAGNSLIAASGTATTIHVTAAATAAHSALKATFSVLNTRVGDRTLFSGLDSSNLAVSTADTMMDAVEAAITAAGATGVSSVETAIDDWFAAAGGYEGTVYLGADPLVPVPVSAGETVAIDVTANDPALRATLKGLAMAALVDRGLFAGQPDMQRDLAQRAGEVLFAGESDRVHLIARLGGLQSQVDQAQTRNEAEAAALSMARTEMLEIDPYETATKLQDAESQLELIYSITARIARLSLADYL